MISTTGTSLQRGMHLIRSIPGRPGTIIGVGGFVTCSSGKASNLFGKDEVHKIYVYPSLIA